jgi:hypothetical protein
MIVHDLDFMRLAVDPADLTAVFSNTGYPVKPRFPELSHEGL